MVCKQKGEQQIPGSRGQRFTTLTRFYFSPESHRVPKILVSSTDCHELIFQIVFPNSSMFHLPAIITPFHILFLVSALAFSFFWIWAIGHSSSTPKSTTGQRIFWSGSMIVNPITTVWYWYIWKRWAFWLLFTPLLILFATGPFIIKSVLKRGDTESIVKLVTAPGSWVLFLALSCFIVFPLILRLIALVHLGKNQDMSAMDRNDWIVALGLPIFGFGAGIAYCAKHRRNWAIASLAWWVIATLGSYEAVHFTRAALAQTHQTSSSSIAASSVSSFK